MQHGRILKTPDPEVDIVSLADAGVRIALRPWCKAEDYWQVQYEVYRALLERFREQDIQIAYPVREIRMRPTKA
jgi:small conductance mechanosensitive channel